MYHPPRQTSTAELRNQRAVVFNEAETLLVGADVENRPLTASEESEFKRLEARIDTLTREISLAEKREATQMDELKRTAGGMPDFNGGAVPDDPMSRVHVPFGGPKLTAFPNNAAGREAAYKSGMWAAAALYGDPKATQWCREHGVMNIATEGVNTAGGILTPIELSSAIISMLSEYGVARRECRTIQMTSDTLVVPVRQSGLTAGFYGEGVEIQESDVVWKNLELHPKKCATLSRISAELRSDSIIDLAQFIATEAAYAFSALEDSCWLNGTGTSEFGGMRGLTQILIDGSHDAGKVAADSGHNTYAEIDADDLSTTMAALPDYALRGAKWYCSPVAWSLVFEPILAAGGGNAISDLSRQVTRSYLGYEVVVSNAMPSSTGDLANKVMILFGNAMQSSLFGSRNDIRIALSGDRWFELDLLGVRSTERFQILSSHGCGDNTTAGPMVALVGTT